MFLRGFIHQGKQDYYKKRDALSLRCWIVYWWGLMPSGKFFLYLTHWANLHTCTYNSRAVFFDFLHINIISHTHEFHTKVSFLHFFGRYLLAFTRKSCFFFLLICRSASQFNLLLTSELGYCEWGWKLFLQTFSQTLTSVRGKRRNYRN